MTEILGEDTEALGEGVASVAVKITPIADAKAVECLPMTMAGMLESQHKLQDNLCAAGGRTGRV